MKWGRLFPRKAPLSSLFIIFACQMYQRSHWLNNLDHFQSSNNIDGRHPLAIPQELLGFFMSRSE
ncbi:hypothetical protein M8C21_006332 [Ambrosia artemisiifolia]|uniref:Uncharacterized protein n=1 Tax=Ambrosia artemisiifolia TaxID=4212 RepID=A0AAD5D3R0_AMBAR|nr:hypothetical protein M8C21_006332 [Ambrosia artemisiifolia]